MTTGGTGFSQRDITPEATLAVVERETRGIPEAMRWASLQITPRGCLSRSAAGIRGKTLIVNLPGSEKAARENLLSVIEAISHGMDMLFSDGSRPRTPSPRAPSSFLNPEFTGVHKNSSLRRGCFHPPGNGLSLDFIRLPRREEENCVAGEIRSSRGDSPAAR